MNKIIVYTLADQGNLGFFPECNVIEIDDNGELSVDFTKITTANQSNFKYLFDSTDQKLFQCCLQLERDTILSKISNRDIRNWDALTKYCFENKPGIKKLPEFEFIKEYVGEYISRYQNVFFENFVGKKLYLPVGRFPFAWKQLSIEEELPEMFYRFESNADSINYSLEISCKNLALDLLNGDLISRNSARILLKNKIYEFEKGIDGNKLVPFFSKDVVFVPASNRTVYIEKVILPLVPTNRVKAKGFDIQIISEISAAVLRVKEQKSLKQISLFDDDDDSLSLPKEILIELIFEYDSFKYWAGQGGAVTAVKYHDDSYTIFKVERDIKHEKQIIRELKKLGLNLDAKIVKLNYIDGFEWINLHFKEIETTGVEIRIENRSKGAQKLFLGERQISFELEEKKDWFDIKGKVLFGEFEMPFLQVLNYIKQNRREMMLPNGEYVQIPQAWFDEYLSLIELCKFEDGIAKVPKHYCMMVNELGRKPSVKLSVKENMKHFLANNHDIDYALPEKFDGVLRHYQQQGYNWLRLLDEMNLGGCLADDMGLGKTIQALCLLQWMKENNRGTSLLVVPTSLVYNWEQEAQKFTPELQMYVHVGIQRTKNIADLVNADVIVTSYAILRRDKELFAKLSLNYIILDEAQAIKNPQADITQVCLTLKAQRFLTLTGTPLENSVTDLWSQVHFFNRNMLGTSNHFVNACKVPEKQQLYRQLIQPFLLRRHKNNVLKDLPEKSIFVQYCDMTKEQHDFYKDIRNSYRDKFIENKDVNGRVNSIIMLEGLLRLRQSANHPVMVDKEYAESSAKFETVCQLLQEVIAQGDKVLIFSSFVEHLKLYRSYLDSLSVPYCYLDGSTKDRKMQVENFQQNDEYQVFLLSLKAGGVGLNLTKASYVFLLDPWWNPAAEAQAFDRAHRIGQKNKVFVYKFITRNSIEEKILKLQEEKLQLFNEMIESGSDVSKNLNINELIKLIE